MAWVTGIKQVTIFQPERDGKQAIPKPVRVVSSLLPHAIERTLQRPAVLPENTGAGPCGTLARRDWTPRMIDQNKLLLNRYIASFATTDLPPFRSMSPMAWSIVHLAQPLQAWYEKQNRPRDPLSRSGVPHGARSGGGNGRVTLW